MCAHCTCLAGLGEACSHISALLFTAETNTQFRNDDTSCTSTLCSWSAVNTKKCEYVPICKIDFTTPLREGNLQQVRFRTLVFSLLHSIRSLQKRNFRSCIGNYLSVRKKPPFLSIVPGFCVKYVPRSESGCLPKPLISFFDERLLEASFPQLLEMSEEVFQNITISSVQAKVLDKSVSFGTSTGLDELLLLMRQL